MSTHQSCVRHSSWFECTETVENTM